MADISTANLDAGTDSPRLARIELLEAVQRVNYLADATTATKGAGLLGWLSTLAYAAGTVGWALRSLAGGGSVLRHIPVSEWPAIANGTTTTDLTTYMAAALAAQDDVYIPKGLFLGQWNLTNLRGKTLRGAGRDVTILKNFGNVPVIKLNNTASDCKLNVLEGFRIQNRNTATYPAADGIEIDGNATNENDFHTFRNIEILQMRHGVNVKNRTIWNTWQDVHIAASLADGFHLDVAENVSQQTFITCRFGTSVGHGIYLKKAAGDALSGWSLVNCTSEKNGLNGLRVEGAASGIAGFSMLGCYMEENTTTVAAAATSPRKANIFIDSSLCIGFTVDGSALYGTPLATPLDWGIYISSATASGRIGPCRPGSFTLGFANLSGAFIVEPQDGGTTSVTKSAGSIAHTEIVAESSDSFTLTLTGCTTSPTGTATAVRHKSTVTLSLPTVTGTSNTTVATLTGLPAAFWPAVTRTVLARVTNNGTTVLAIAQISTAGVVQIYADAGGASFTASGTKGAQAGTLTFAL